MQVTVQQALQSAIQLLQSGQLAQAESVLRQILQADPNNSEAIHCLAYIANSAGNIDASLQLIQRAIELNPNVSVYHKNLGVIFMARKQSDAAANAFRRANQLDPRDAEPVMKLGMLQEEKGQLDEAMELYRKAIALAPQYAEAHCNMGDILAKKDQFPEALACYDQAIRINPNLAEAYANRGTIMDRLARDDEAIADMTRALQINPNMVHALRAMGVFSYRRNQLEQSISFCRRATELAPDFALAHSSLGIAYLRSGRCQEAVDACRRSIECDPNFLDPYVNLGLALTDLGRHDEALAAYEVALQRDPTCDSPRANRAMIYLVRGQYEQGFADYDFRWTLNEFSAAGRDYQCPRWEGQDLQGKTILIWHEQGLGDTINFIRYAKLLAQKGATVIAEVQPSLQKLLASVDGVSKVIVRTDPLPAIDYHEPMLRLPGAMHTRLETIPGGVPYVHADPALVEEWQQRVAPHAGFRVGITWCGNPFLRLEYERSVPLSHFLPIARVPGVKLFSLQMGSGSEQARPAPFELIDLTSHIRDFSDTAALIANLDLVIVVDTAVLHLSAAMGRPTWGLIQRWPDWRWQLDREDSPWYPTLRLFRQSEYRNWPPVFDRAATELAKMIDRAS